MKKPRLGTNDWGQTTGGDEQGFFDAWVTRDERNAHHGERFTTFGLPSDLAFCLSATRPLDPSSGPLTGPPHWDPCRLLWWCLYPRYFPSFWWQR